MGNNQRFRAYSPSYKKYQNSIKRRTRESIHSTYISMSPWSKYKITFANNKPVNELMKRDVWSSRIAEYDVAVYPTCVEEKIRQERSKNVINITGIPADCTAEDLTPIIKSFGGKLCTIQKRRLRTSNKEISNSVHILK
jgi:hypothetical protein